MCVLPGVIVFIEVKAPNRKPKKHQWRWINWLKHRGHKCIVVDSRPRVDAFITWYERFIENGNSV